MLNDFAVVGIGASAGGIQSLQEFFRHVAADSGMAYVVILHLSPNHESHLTSVLQSVSTVPMIQVTERMLVQPNHVYIIPPNQHLEMIDGFIEVSPNLTVEDRRAPIDIFFRTLAEIHEQRAICVILSGTGADGSMGLKRVKEQGGGVFVQSPREAEFNEMPRNAIATNLVDDILPVAQIPAKILAYQAALEKIETTLPPEQRAEAQQHTLHEIFTLLRQRTGHDFINYKRPTMLRRIERRINLHDLPDLAAYAEFLESHPTEVQLLQKDLLISVTNFFRDKAAFEVMEREILPKLFDGKTSADQVRIWVVASATGEEAYSLAMLCTEHMRSMVDAPKVQIFATDLDDSAISTARNGYYTLNDLADVSPERTREFFTEASGGFRVRRELREMVLFTAHNVLKDTPFSHLDLVTCRNLLIYLNQTAQTRVLETFHFALNPGGYLFLGSAESIDGTSSLYAPISREHHIYQRQQAAGRIYPLPESKTGFRFESVSSDPQSSGTRRTLENLTYGDLHQQLLEQYGPPSVVINKAYDIVHMSDTALRYLQLRSGEPSINLLVLISADLRLELRTALYQAVQRQTNIVVNDLKVNIHGSIKTLNLHVRPVLRKEDSKHGFILVLFEHTEPGKDDPDTIVKSNEPVNDQLEEEILNLKAQLSMAAEQHEVQEEELKSSNEELQSVNEELRSAAEELETSKEELQSINEELRTVNQELKVKVEETTQVSDNLQNLANASEIAILFLDRSFRIKLFTPAVRTLFNVLHSDINRPLSDITHRLVETNLISDAEIVLDNLLPIQREMQTLDHLVYRMRIMPFRSLEDRITGVVITLLDITELKKAEDALQQRKVILEQRVQEQTNELNIATENRNNLLHRLISTQEEERTRIARELHDQTAQQLTILIHGLTRLKQLPPTEPIQDAVNELISIVHTHVDEVHKLIQDLHSPVLDMFGLASALQDHAKRWTAWSGIGINVECINLENAPLSSEITITIYRIVQEALTNVMRHGKGATHVEVTVMEHQGELSAMVEDNGPGFDVKALAQLPPEKRRLGLAGMQQRALLVGGTLTVESTIGQGTIVSLQIPSTQSSQP